MKPTPEQIEAARALKFLCEEITDREGREGMTDLDFAEQVIALAQSMKPKAEAALTAAAEVGEPQPDNPAYVSERAMRVATDAERESCAQVAEQFSHYGGTGRAIAAAIRARKDTQVVEQWPHLNVAIHD